MPASLPVAPKSTFPMSVTARPWAVHLLIPLFMLASISCADSPTQISEPFPHYRTQESDWIIYEGVLPSENGQEIQAELYLAPGAPGMDSHYKLIESMVSDDKKSAMSTSSRGTYVVLFGSAGHNIIQITSRKRISSLMRNQRFGKSDHVTENLYLKSNHDNELILVDENSQEITPQYTLIRRSALFTVEGYFTVYNDTSEYYERNTRKKWAVARFAYYDEAVRKYRMLATEKYEGVYLKALSYSIRHNDASGKEVDALVFKKILHMDSTGGIQHH